MTEYEYDLIVIGGGSGGLAASKEAIDCGAKQVAVFDYVVPTTHGTKWGLGGTCVNVGCVPKKLMHYAASLSPLIKEDAKKFGWILPDDIENDWEKLIKSIQEHVRSLNFSYRVGLKKKGIQYFNARAHVEDAHSIAYFDSKTDKVVLTTKYILIAVGGRPYVPPENVVPGALKYAITSDDLFSWPHPPGKTLVVGASYIALECAGCLVELGFDTTVAVRSVLLRSFDRQCAEKIGQLMEEIGTRFIKDLPVEIIKQKDGKLLVKFQNQNNLVFDTVLYAIGRKADTEDLNLSSIGVKVDAFGKIIATNEQSSVPSIYAIGDALHGSPELTPVAIRTGVLLARRLFGSATECMNWNLYPTTVFTPFEYGCCGLSEESAKEIYGSEKIEVFLYEFTTLQLAAVHRNTHAAKKNDEYVSQLSPNSLAKLVCTKPDYRAVGFHFVGLNAGEITQGYSLALRLGATKKDFDETIAIHPTDAEAFHDLRITKNSGLSWIASGGCGGGKCG